MAQYEHLPIYKAAFDLLIYFEKVVKGFSRYNKYTLGTELRQTALRIVRLIIRANNSRNKLPVLEETRIELEEIKVLMRVCKEVKAFSSFNSFETGINQVIRLAKQNEGWIRSLSGKKKWSESPEQSL